MTSVNQKGKLTKRRGVAPVIATLLLVAIAVVGGSIVFVFSQGFFSSAQVSGTPTIESLKINGYDARDGTQLALHEGTLTNSTSGVSDNGLIAGERVVVYLQNQGVSKVTLNEVRFAGTVYDYAPQASIEDHDTNSEINDGNFAIVLENDGTQDVGLDTTAPEIQPGQQVTVLIELDENIKTGRDGQIKFTTANGAVFVGTVVAGQQSG